MLSGQGSAGGSGGGQSSSNQCGGPEGDPSNWNAACRQLFPTLGTFATCMDANPTFGMAAPTLPNGGDPAQLCKVFTNADAVGTALGDQPSTCCDHECGAVGCYCCP